MNLEDSTMKSSKNQSDFWDRFSGITGKIDYTLTNDYMFRALLQRRENVLKGLVAALLHLDLAQIRECTVTNPIELGKAINDKDYILDIRLLLNDDRILNLEMQKLNEKNWPERSISYTCRAFDQLQKGQDYDEVLPVINIGFLDFTLFPEVPEFYARNLLMNVKNHYIYSRKLDIRVVDLKQIGLATEEDRRYGIDRWARLFKSTTWEGIRMIAEKDLAMQEATKGVPAATFTAMQKKDVTVEFVISKDVSWTVNGKDVDNPANVNLGMTLNSTNVPADTVKAAAGESATLQISLAHDGNFPFKKGIANVNVGTPKADQYANLFYYNPTTKALEFNQAVKVAKNGIASFTFTHASDYVVTFTAEPYKAPGTSDSMPVSVWMIGALLFLGAAAFAGKKRFA